MKPSNGSKRPVMASAFIVVTHFLKSDSMQCRGHAIAFALPPPDGVEPLEHDPERVEEAVATRASRIGGVALDDFLARQWAVGLGLDLLEVCHHVGGWIGDVCA